MTSVLYTDSIVKSTALDLDNCFDFGATPQVTRVWREGRDAAGPDRGRHGMMGCTWRRLRMESTARWGITLPLRSLPLPDQRGLVAALPDLGYTDAWSSEVNGADAFTPLAVAAQWTTGLRFGTAIAGI